MSSWLSMRFLPSALASSILLSVTVSEACAACFCPCRLSLIFLFNFGCATGSQRPSNSLLSSMSAWTPVEPLLVNCSFTLPCVSVDLLAFGRSFGLETVFLLELLLPEFPPEALSPPSPLLPWSIVPACSFSQSMSWFTAVSILSWIFWSASLTACATLSMLRSFASNLIPRVNPFASALSTKLMAFETFPCAMLASSLVKALTRFIILVKFSLMNV